jgi:hypothetical protein
MDDAGPPPFWRPKFADDLLRGAAAIAEFLFGDKKHRRKIYHLIETSRFPHFKMGSMVCTLRSSVLEWIEEQQRRNLNQPRSGSRSNPKPPPEPDPINGPDR